MFQRLKGYLPSRFQAHDSPSDEGHESGSEVGSEGSFEDCESDADVEMEFPDDKTETAQELSLATENSVYPPLSSIDSNAVPTSHGKEGYFTDLSAADDFIQTSPLLQSADSKKIFNQTKAVAVYKNELQTFCQRKKMQMPAYDHEREGPAHAPKFKATVQVDGKRFESDRDHGSKVEAEQAAAREALIFLNQGCSNPLKRLSTQQHQAMVKLEPSNVNNNDGRSGGFVEGNGRCSQISRDPSVTVKTEMSAGQSRARDGMTIDTATDFTTDEWSVEQSPTLTAASSPESIARSLEEILGAKYSASLQGMTTSSQQMKKPILWDNGAPPAGVESHSEGLAGRFSGLQLNKRSSILPEVNKSARKTQIVRWPTQTEHLVALGKLDFATHAFPLLTRLDGLPLEEAYSVEEIEGLQNTPANDVYSHLHTLDGYKRPDTRLPLSRVPDEPELLLYDCHICAKGELRFRAEGNRQGSTLLQRTLGFDKVLRVFFDGMIPHAHYKDFLKNGIFVGRRYYEFFVYKPADRLTDKDSEGSEGVKCYFVCTDSRGDKDLNDDRFRKFNSIIEARTLFMHIHNCATVAKYIARSQLCLTKTRTIEISFSDVNIKELEDLRSKDKSNPDAMFTDGTGFISTDLAKLMPASIFKGMTPDEVQGSDPLYEDYPTLIQTRVFHNGAAYKGTLLARKDTLGELEESVRKSPGTVLLPMSIINVQKSNPATIGDLQLPSKTIHFYKSMKKVEADPSCYGSISSFELVSTSPRPKRAKLSQDLIVLLSIGGVDESVFLDAVRAAAEDVLLILRDRKRALREVQQWEWESDVVEITVHMLEAGIPLEEPHLRKNLLILTKNKMQDFAKGKVPLEGTFYLMGTADPSGKLKPNEVAIFLADGGAINGNVLVHRPPGKHPGEMRKLKAVHSQALQDIVGVGKNVIFFSTQGYRPVTHEIANGDLDGDCYWICHNPKVLEQFKEWPSRWSPGDVNCREGKSAQSLEGLTPEKLEDIIIDEYFKERFSKSSLVGIAFFRWLAHVDLYLHPDTPADEKEVHKTEFLKYPDYVYEGVDSAKSGKELTLPQRHHLIKWHNPPYLKKIPERDVKGGKTILGKICDLGLRAQEIQKTSEYGRETFQLDPTFFVRESVNHTGPWKKLFDKYRGEMRKALDKDKKDADPGGPERVNSSYKRILYGGPSFKERTRHMETVLAEASAIYQIVYSHGMKNIDSDSDKEPSVAFAWNVAGPALCFMYAEKQPGRNCVVSASGVYRETRKRGPGSAPRRVLTL